MYIYSDHSLRVIANHQNSGKIEFYKSASPLPVGQHTLELYGSVSQAAPWYFKVDGVVLASGVARLSPDTVPANERVVTRLNVGIDGAADQDLNSMQVLVKSFEIAEYDLSGSNPPPPTATVIVPTATLTQVPTPTKIATVAPPSPTTIPITPTLSQPNSSAPTPAPGARSLDVRIANGSNDVEERADGSMYMGSTDMELVTDGAPQTIGLRFGNLNIPAGATIVNAFIQFKTDQATSTATSLIISGEARANAAAFTTSARNVSSRARTRSIVMWAPPAWSTVGAMGANQRTPNLAPVIQEIINQNGWASGNSLVILIAGNGKRVAEAYEGDRTGAALLHIEYTTNTTALVAGPTVVPTASPTATAQPTQVPPTATLQPTQPVLPTDTPTPIETSTPVKTPTPGIPTP